MQKYSEGILRIGDSPIENNPYWMPFPGDCVMLVKFLLHSTFPAKIIEKITGFKEWSQEFLSRIPHDNCCFDFLRKSGWTTKKTDAYCWYLCFSMVGPWDLICFSRFMSREFIAALENEYVVCYPGSVGCWRPIFRSLYLVDGEQVGYPVVTRGFGTTDHGWERKFYWTVSSRKRRISVCLTLVTKFLNGRWLISFYRFSLPSFALFCTAQRSRPLIFRFPYIFSLAGSKYHLLFVVLKWSFRNLCFYADQKNMFVSGRTYQISSFC